MFKKRDIIIYVTVYGLFAPILFLFVNYLFDGKWDIERAAANTIGIIIGSLTVWGLRRIAGGKRP